MPHRKSMALASEPVKNGLADGEQVSLSRFGTPIAGNRWMDAWWFCASGSIILMGQGAALDSLPHAVAAGLSGHDVGVFWVAKS